jgi:hypothetical protein
VQSGFGAIVLRRTQVALHSRELDKI